MTSPLPDPSITDQTLHDRSARAEQSFSIALCLVIMATMTYSVGSLVPVVFEELLALVMMGASLVVVMYVLLVSRPRRGHVPSLCAQCLSGQGRRAPEDLRLIHWTNGPVGSWVSLVVIVGLFLGGGVAALFEILWGMLLILAGLALYTYYYRAWREHFRWQHVCASCPAESREWAAARVEYSRALTGSS